MSHWIIQAAESLAFESISLGLTQPVRGWLEMSLESEQQADIGPCRDRRGFYRKNFGLNIAIKVYKGRECYGAFIFFKDYTGILWGEWFC